MPCCCESTNITSSGLEQFLTDSIVVVISPLNALIADQTGSCEKLGIRACKVDSESVDRLKKACEFCGQAQRFSTTKKQERFINEMIKSACVACKLSRVRKVEIFLFSSFPQTITTWNNKSFKISTAHAHQHLKIILPQNPYSRFKIRPFGLLALKSGVGYQVVPKTCPNAP